MRRLKTDVWNKFWLLKCRTVSWITSWKWSCWFTWVRCTSFDSVVFIVCIYCKQRWWYNIIFVLTHLLLSLWLQRTYLLSANSFQRNMVCFQKSISLDNGHFILIQGPKGDFVVLHTPLFLVKYEQLPHDSHVVILFMLPFCSDFCCSVISVHNEG